MGDGTEENPYTREDVLRLIEENGGTAEGLDLSWRTFEEFIDLSELDLQGLILKKSNLSAFLAGGAGSYGADMDKRGLIGPAHIERTDLRFANLEGANLLCAHLEEANLSLANLQGTDLRGAYLNGVTLYGAKFSADTKFEGVNWGNYILGEERNREWDRAMDTYCRLKMWHTNAGMYDIASEFFYREMTTKRKTFWWGEGEPGWPLKDLVRLFTKGSHLEFLVPRSPLHWIRSMLYNLICGYGERPWQVALWGMLVLFGLALLYFLLRGVAPYTFTVQAFLASLYYSAVSFTALGYGPWFSTGSVRGWAQGVGAAEAIVGVFTIALFLITFVRKMAR